MSYRILHGDVRETLATLEPESVHAIITDPPYELGFMGKTWDSTGIAYSVAMWADCLRVLKPGGHLLSFSGSRTYHRMVVAIEDAGFEIRDQIMWVYGSGFPKSLDVSKSIDKAARGVPQGGADPTSVNHGKFKGGCSDDNPSGKGFGAGPGHFMREAGVSASRELVASAKQWVGWGTALKPAHEPIVVARKPFTSTVAANVLEHGTGALNIDACRVGWASDLDKKLGRPASFPTAHNGFEGKAFAIADRSHRDVVAEQSQLGRWPANLIHDGSDEVLAEFAKYGESKGAAAPVTLRNGDKFRNSYGAFAGNRDEQGSTFQGDTGSAARFFYSAKASKKDRGEGNTHPTVKPTELMQYLCRLVTPPGGTVLDPFCGSGSTGVAARREGFHFIGIDQAAEHTELSRDRIREDCPLFNTEGAI